MIENHETYLVREDAERLAKLGFDWGNSRNSIFYPEDGSEECPDGVWAPRVGLARTWLYNTYNAVVIIEPWWHSLDEKNIHAFRYAIYLDNERIDSRPEYTHPDEALTEGVKLCIKLIAKKHAQSTQER